MLLIVGVWPTARAVTALREYPRRDEGWSGEQEWLANVRPLGNVTDAVADEVLEQTAALLKGTELDEARAVWRKRFGKTSTDPQASTDPRASTNARERARQARFLQGRGFSAEVIRRVVGSEPEE